jgi:hypothetical protein
MCTGVERNDGGEGGGSGRGRGWYPPTATSGACTIRAAWGRCSALVTGVVPHDAPLGDVQWLAVPITWAYRKDRALPREGADPDALPPAARATGESTRTSSWGLALLTACTSAWRHIGHRQVHH